MRQPTCFIGWDVGGWHCDRNRASRDALVILDEQGQILGQPWRGNLRETLVEAHDVSNLITRLTALCRVRLPSDVACLMAVDATLGFPEAFRRLFESQQPLPPVGPSGEANPFLFRETDRFLSRHGFRPLSPIKDMIGAQATKALYLLRRFAPRLVETGVWQDHYSRLMVIEAYPSTLRALPDFSQPISLADVHSDIQDAWCCARLGWMFVQTRHKLVPPPDGVDPMEGWIWVPQSALEGRGWKT